jgi:hypothetical protein
MSDNRHISDEYAAIGEMLIASYDEFKDIREAEITIVYLASTQAKKQKGKLVFGQCEKIADKYKWGIPADFTITVFEPNIEGFTPEQVEALIFHELLHVGVEDDRLFIRPHDIEDFSAVLKKYGVDWATLPFES